MSHPLPFRRPWRLDAPKPWRWKSDASGLSSKDADDEKDVSSPMLFTELFSMATNHGPFRLQIAKKLATTS